ncbi:MAG: AI-2E family transporter, partial [Coriobacteriales bacterium]|nr:AI-2E family transporter [Coriobacteriales bacterium]
FSGYIRGQFVDAVLVGVMTSFVLTAIGVPYGPLVGLVTGIGNLIPYVGGPMGYATMALACVAEADSSRLLIGIVALSAIMVVDGNIINPRLLSHAVEVHPLVVFVAIIAGNAIGGLAGMLIAVPCAAFLKIQLDRWLVQREESLGRLSS